MNEKILPFYLAIDTSASMRDVVPVLETSLQNLQSAIVSDATVSELAKVSIVSFGSEARQDLKLSDLGRLKDGLPRLMIEGQTNYRAVFELLRDAIDLEISWYLDRSYRVLRPTVYFITDGHPTEDDWRPAHERLTSSELFKYHPNIVSFGFGPAVDEATLQATATGRAFVANDPKTMPGPVLAQIAHQLTNSIVASTRSTPGSGSGSLLLNEEIPGMIDVSSHDGEITIDPLDR